MKYMKLVLLVVAVALIATSIVNADWLMCSYVSTTSSRFGDWVVLRNKYMCDDGDFVFYIFENTTIPYEIPEPEGWLP